MWVQTFHRFADRAAFLAACAEAGWPYPPGQEPEPPAGVSLDVIGPLIGPASIGPGGIPLPGAVMDAGYHVNLAWHAREMDVAFAASQVAPATPSRAWDLPAEPEPGPLPVPVSVPAWKGKAALREAGLLEMVETAVQAAGGRVRDAWDGAAEWDRGSDFLVDLAGALGLKDEQVDQMFREADAMRG
ncbi:MAG: hypothetical protein IT555_21435 [Acetobacteraceae bacterium]|nr:hypothetical protein [Acetobacteraceae bacterium]